MSRPTYAQQLRCQWEELTASDWPKALALADSTCILPISVLEKHGPHAPIGSDIIQARAWAQGAARQEFAVVFPDYFYGQINEARHQPGTFGLPEKITFELLEATCDEIAHNGFKKILIINSHGGNINLIRYLMQTQLEKPTSYAVYFFEQTKDPVFEKKYKALHKSYDPDDEHAGEAETSAVLALRPELVQLSRAATESGANQHRLNLPSSLYTAIGWYADFPNHYAGDGSQATKELGELINERYITQLVQALKAVKADQKTLRLQREFFKRQAK